MQREPGKQQSVVCTHISKLSKKILQRTLETANGSQCSFCNKMIAAEQQCFDTDLWVCLGCGGLVCCKVCRSNHLKEFLTHIFSVSIGEHLVKLGEGAHRIDGKSLQIYCQLCSNTLVNDCVDSTESQQTAELSKLRRFRSYIENEIFPQLIQTLSDGLWSKQAVWVCGLANLGNSCFLNAVLQSLNSLQQFEECYRNQKWGTQTAESSAIVGRNKAEKRQIELFYDTVLEDHQQNQWIVVVDRKIRKKDRVSGTRNTTISNTYLNESLSRLFMQMQQSADTVEPIDVLQQLSAVDAKYKFKQQQDAEELLVMLLDCLSRGERLKISNKSRYEQIEGLLGRQKYTLTQSIFASYLCSHVTCMGCRNQSWVLDLTYHLPVPLKSTQKPLSNLGLHNDVNSSSINGIRYFEQLFYPLSQAKAEILQPLFEAERLTKEENYYQCEKCSASEAIKKLYLVSAPKVLIVSLKRFEKHGKISSHVPFEEFICIDGICLQGESERELCNGSKRYRLSSVIVHQGDTAQSGHYYSLVRRGGSWLRCSDESVCRVSWQQVESQMAYILFYEGVQ